MVLLSSSSCDILDLFLQFLDQCFSRGFIDRNIHIRAVSRLKLFCALIAKFKEQPSVMSQSCRRNHVESPTTHLFAQDAETEPFYGVL